MRRRLVLSTHMILFIWISSICTGQTPDEINGLNLWLRADSVSGTSVSQWYDLSTNGSSILQSNSSFQPVKINNVLNGHPVVDFDGVNDYIDCGDSLLGATTTQSITVNSWVKMQDGHFARTSILV